MAISHNLGFPRIGRKRELKYALENYWNSTIDATDLLGITKQIRLHNVQTQAQLDYVPVGDFSLYDHVLDMSVTLGNLPERSLRDSACYLDDYFRTARGRSFNDQQQEAVHASEMTKWFDTNYHFIVPELTAKTDFKLNPTIFLQQVKQAKASGNKIKPVILGPVSYLKLAKSKDKSEPINFVEQLMPVYFELLALLSKEGIDWVQIDEPILVTELEVEWQDAFKSVYERLKSAPLNILLTTYFGTLKENLHLACDLPVAGLHIDVATDQSEINTVLARIGEQKILSLGVINGRNVWKTDLSSTLDWLQPIADKLGERLWIAPSCSLLHVPVDVSSEEKIAVEIKNWLAFAVQKLAELTLLTDALNKNLTATQRAEIAENKAAILSRNVSTLVNKASVKEAVLGIDDSYGLRDSPYQQRTELQSVRYQLPKFPTTTIGSFPQTSAIRTSRLRFKRGELDAASYQQEMQTSIQHAVEEQEKLGLDVLVHGEAERNDMVEYFGEQLDGYVFSECGWVQSYGSRCVKPPILYGDISRPEAMTVKWTEYAQSLTTKPMKGMLTGPVTLLNWSFVRDDQARRDTCMQLALAIREEVLDLENAGVSIIQIDEAALREGLPLRKSDWQVYLDWAVEAFRIAANGVNDKTQIHTHMCYSEFNDIIESIASMDADVITIETSRSDMELLEVFENFDYPNEIGPGVYDIHSPNIPKKEQVIHLLEKASKRIPAERLWVNPDCGLKTRQWSEVVPALENMVAAAKELRQQYN